MAPDKKLYIGLVGTNGAGKSFVCKYLETKNFQVFSLSDIVREEATKRNLELNRDNLVWTGNLLKSLLGDNVLAKEVYQKAIINEVSFAVFDSIRHTKEVDFLKKKNVFIIGIDAPMEIRYDRIKIRQKETDKVSFETFKEHDERENSGASPGQSIRASLNLCNIIIENSGSLTNLQKNIDDILSKL